MSEIRPPSEGLSTLSAQFTASYLRKLTGVVRAFREKGMAEEGILKKLQAGLPDFDERTVHGIYLRSLGRPVPDDFPAENVASETEEPRGGLVLDLREAPKMYKTGALVSYKGKDYCVVRMLGPRVWLKIVPER